MVLIGIAISTLPKQTPGSAFHRTWESVDSLQRQWIRVQPQRNRTALAHFSRSLHAPVLPVLRTGQLARRSTKDSMVKSREGQRQPPTNAITRQTNCACNRRRSRSSHPRFASTCDVTVDLNTSLFPSVWSSI